MKTLITMPNYDDATSYLYYYAEELVKFAEEKNITVSQLKRPRLRRKILEESITKQNPHSFSLMHMVMKPQFTAIKLREKKNILFERKRITNFLPEG